MEDKSTMTDPVFTVAYNEQQQRLVKICNDLEFVRNDTLIISVATLSKKRKAEAAFFRGGR